MRRAAAADEGAAAWRMREVIVIDAGLFSFRTLNLGDDMQTYAALAHVNRVDRLLDRDHLADAAGPDVACIFNSWFMLGDDFRAPATCVKPVWQGFAVGRSQLLEGEWLERLKQQRVGARDTHSVNLLHRAGVDAHWSGCLTLFLGRALSLAPRRRRGVLFVDVPSSAESLIPANIVRRAVRLSTFTPESMAANPFERWAAVARLLELIAGAELVVTRRLHVALPAASLGVPVVAIPDPEIAWARDRFSGFERVIPLAFLDDFERNPGVVDWRAVAPAQIPADVERSYQAFRRTVADLGLEAVPDAPFAHASLERSSCRTQWLHNVVGGHHPARIRLRLGDWAHELNVLLWSDRLVEVALPGFPGLAKFALTVEGSVAGSAWTPWGRLQDLVQDSYEGIGENRSLAATPTAA